MIVTQNDCCCLFDFSPISTYPWSILPRAAFVRGALGLWSDAAGQRQFGAGGSGGFSTLEECSLLRAEGVLAFRRWEMEGEWVVSLVKMLDEKQGISEWIWLDTSLA